MLVLQWQSSNSVAPPWSIYIVDLRFRKIFGTTPDFFNIYMASRARMLVK
jgi:hypothetical protein